jgi:hypothetical protein
MMEYFPKLVKYATAGATATALIITDNRVATGDVCIFSAANTAAAIAMCGATATVSVYATVASGVVTLKAPGDWAFTSEVFNVIVFPRSINSPGNSHPGT